jgi:hypothetical protein
MASTSPLFAPVIRQLTWSPSLPGPMSVSAPLVPAISLSMRAKDAIPGAEPAPRSIVSAVVNDA